LSTPAFVSKLHAEVLELHGEPQNFTSLLRCTCLLHREDPPPPMPATSRRSDECAA